MGTRRARLRARAAVAVCAASALAAVWSCRDPTEVTLNITTDVPCSKVIAAGGAKIVVGTISGDLDTKPALAQSGQVCTPNPIDPVAGENSIGTFVVIPDQGAGSSESFSVLIVMGDDTSLDDCGKIAPGKTVPDYTGCIVARREISFVPHTPLTLPIALDKDCVSVNCGSTDQTCVKVVCGSDPTCIKHTCLPANAKCGNGECSLATPEDAGIAPPVDDGPDETTTSEDAGPDHEVADSAADQGSDVSSGDATEDAPVDTAPAEATQPEPSGPDAPIDAPIDMTVDAPLDVAAEGPGPGMDATADVGVDATKDAPAESSPTLDASNDAASQDASSTDAAEASTPDGALVDDGGLGSCVSTGTFAGVECSGGTCAPGNVCCVDHDPIGATTFETCTTPSGCPAGLNGLGHQISSYACRNRGDCTTGQVCCAGTAASAGLIVSCVAAASCTGTFTQLFACRNTCECPTTMCKEAVGGCYGEPIATCGGACP